MDTKGSVQRVTLSELAQSQSHARADPLIVTGLSRSRSETPGWPLDSIRRAIGDETTNDVRRFTDTAPRKLTGTDNLSFKEYVGHLRSGEAEKHDMYWAYSSPGEAFTSAMLASTKFVEAEMALGLDALHVDGAAGRLSAWVGPCNHVERLHYDDDDNLHLMLEGRKRWLLFPPSEVVSQRLGFLPLLPLLWGEHTMEDGVGGDPASSDVNPYSVDPLTVTLQPGEALYLPAGWAHQVEAMPSDRGSERAASNGRGAAAFVFSINCFYPTPVWSAGNLIRAWLVARLRLYHTIAAWRQS